MFDLEHIIVLWQLMTIKDHYFFKMTNEKLKYVLEITGKTILSLLRKR